MFNYHFNIILPHKKFTWTDFGRVYIYPVYTHVATPLLIKYICLIFVDSEIEIGGA